MRIAEKLGFKDLYVDDVVDKPALAAVALAGLQELRQRFTAGEHRTVLVYDLGGGTFDSALLDVNPGSGPSKLTVLASASRLVGGADIDKAILEHVKPAVARELGVTVGELHLLLDQRDWTRLEKAAREVKEELSLTDVGFFTAPVISSAKTISIAVTRQEFEELLARTRIVESTLDCTMEAYRQARMFLNREDGGGFFKSLPGGTAVTHEGKHRGH